MSGIRFTLVFWLVVSSAASAHAAEVAQATSANLEKWLNELGHERYPVREEAHRELWKHGSAALPMLEKLAVENGDPERMLRARDLIRKIVFEIRPDTDADLIKWIESYESASVSEKERLLGQMKDKRAWFPMLRLYAGEKDQDTRAKLRPVIDRVAVSAARESMAAGDTNAARVALELAPMDSESLLSLAVFHRNQGTWNDQWEKLGEKERGGPWGLALLRAADRVAEARALAAELGDMRMAAWFAALEGDPLDWMERMNPEMDEVETEYVQLASRRWRGEELLPQAVELDRLVRRVNGRERSARMGAIQSLFLLSQPGLAEPALKKHMPLEAFLHFEQLEKVPQALEALGLDPVKPDYGSWFRTKFAKYITDNIEDQHGVNQLGAELVAVSGFLERKGLHDVLWDAFAETLLLYAEKDEMGFITFLSMLYGGRDSTIGAPAFCTRISEKWAGEDEDRWSEVLTCAFGEEGDTREWWDWLGLQKPAMTWKERLRIQMAIYRIGDDPHGLRERWIPRLLEFSKNDPEWLKRVSQLAMATEDAALYLKAESHMDGEVRDRGFWGIRISYLSALERWGEVADVIQRHIDLQKEAGTAYVPEVHAYAYLASALRLAGREGEAAKHDAMAESLYLGEAAYALRIGNGYAFGRDYKRALIWWKRACVESDADFSEFAKALKALADGWLEEGEWLRAASLYECLSRFFMNSDYRWETPLVYTQYRLYADTTRAISRLKTNREGAIAALERVHEAFLTDGSLADVFFPSMRRAGLLREHNELFDKTWARFREVIRQYPDADNTRNTAAWMSSRAVRKLEEGMSDIKVALSRRPDQAAYLDTKAELFFAMGNRPESLKWSARAMSAKPDDPLIRKQHARFLLDPFPR
jgi:tetratricopeptide (TPR) repeat protein